MLLGCVVTGPSEVAQAAGLPVDYLELKGDMLCVEGAEFAALRDGLAATGLPCLAMTSPLPRRFGCRVVGPDADPVRALEVFTDMCDRGGSLGVQTVVLGSGQARSVPPGFDNDAAGRQFAEFVTEAAAHCAAHGQRLTLEPLNSTETNFVNSCAQARPVVDELGIGIAVDCFHVVSEGLSVSA